MSNSEYSDREDTVRYSADVADVFPKLNLSDVIRAAGNAALYDDLVLTTGANANKQHGIRSAIYSVADFSNGINLTAGRLTPLINDPELIARDQETLSLAVSAYAELDDVLPKPVFGLAHNITMLVAFPGIRHSVLNAGVELRVAPDSTEYAALLVPKYFRKAPAAVLRYITNSRQHGIDDIDPQLNDIALARDPKKVARLLAISAVSHILDGYEEQDHLESLYKNN